MPSLIAKEEREELKIITINVPKRFLKTFELMIKWGLFPSRSELIRYCILKAFPGLLTMLGNVDKALEMGDEYIEKAIRKWVKKNGYQLVETKNIQEKVRKNIWWDEYNLLNGETIRVPRDPKEVEEEIHGAY